MGFFSNLFSKQNCSICDKECGAMSRSKTSDKLYICNDCRDKCSKYIRISDLTLDDVKGHIEYMARNEKLYNEIFSDSAFKKQAFPSPPSKMGIRFCDELGMLEIVDKTTSMGEMHELIRYDQIASYEPYIDKTPAQEPGKEPTINGGGIKLRLYGARDVDFNNNRRGVRPHPYITREIDVVFAKRDSRDLMYIDNAISRLDFIFGVHDNTNGLFNFGMTKEEKRQLTGAVNMVKAMGSIAKAAKNGADSMSDEEKAKLQENFNAVDDANTGGLAVYTRRADEAEAKISGQ